MSRRAVARVLVSGLLLLALGCDLFAERHTYRQYGSSDGLNNLAATCLLQDRSGYIWIGTDNGLFRYDGARFEYFGHDEGLPNTEVVSLVESSDGTIWAGTHGGVARYSGGRFNIVNAGVSGRTDSIFFDDQGRIYLRHSMGIVRGTADDRGQFQFAPLVQGDVRGVFGQGNEFWYGVDGGVVHSAGAQSTRLGVEHGLPVDSWSALVVDPSGNLWARSATLLYELPRGEARFINRSQNVPRDPDGKLYVDQLGRLYLSSDAGVMVLEGNNRSLIDSRHGLPGDAVSAVLMDRDGNLWLGLRGNGLVRQLGLGEWTALNKDDGLAHNSIWAIQHGPDGKLLVGTSGGLSILGADQKLLRTYTARNGLAGDRVFSIVRDGFGGYFVSTDPAGISRLNGDGVLLQTFRHESGLLGNRAIGLAIDGQRRLLVVGDGGAFRSQPLTSASMAPHFTRLQVPGLPSGAFFYTVVVAPSGMVWFTTSNGLVRLDGDQSTVFDHRDGLLSDDLGGVAVNDAGIWLGYRDALGLSHITFQHDKLLITHLGGKDGLASPQIYAQAFDTAHRLWVSTDNGVDMLAEGRWRHYSKDDGVIWEDGNGYAIHADADGSMWIGTSNGLAHFTPPRTAVPTTSAPVMITAIENGARKLDPANHPELPWSQRSLFIRFTSLDYRSEAHPLFRYRLSGYEKDWTETHERSVHYAGLAAGNYVFEVIARNSDGSWSRQPARFEFTVKAPWWENWWVVGIALLVLGAFAHWLWGYRIRALVRYKEQLELRVAARTLQLRESHKQLTESRQQLLAAMDAAKMGIWSQAVEEDGAATAFTSSDPIAFERVMESILPEDRERFTQILSAQPPGAPPLERQMEMPDGEVRWLEIRGGLVDSDEEKPGRMVGIVMDVTQRKQAEEKMQALEQQLSQAQKMEAVGRLAGGIAHDFNNLLMVIQSYTEMLQEDLPHHESLQSSAEEILKATTRGASLTRQLLAFSRKQVSEPHIVDLNILVHDAAKMLKRLIGEDVEMVLDTAPALWTVKADPHQIVQALVNLCVNARDAMPKGGTLKVTTANLSARPGNAFPQPGLATGDYVLLAVRDTGSGMSKDVRDRIFEPFFTTKADGKGTGLGLATVFGVVQANRGDVWVETEVGRGSCFTICLPRVDGVAAPAPDKQRAGGQRGTETILLAEDEPQLRAAVSGYLRQLGYKVLVAPSGQEALELALACGEPIHLLVTDVVMPKMGGRDLAHALRQQMPGLQIIFISGYTDDFEPLDMNSGGGVAFIQKPFRLTKLAWQVRESLDSLMV